MAGKAKEPFGIAVLALAIAAIACGGGGRETSDHQCDAVLVDILVEIPGGGAQWTEMTQNEKHQLLISLPARPGTKGQYLHECVQEGWTGYYQ